jgi:hypothetical protein
MLNFQTNFRNSPKKANFALSPLAPKPKRAAFGYYQEKAVKPEKVSPLKMAWLQLTTSYGYSTIPNLFLDKLRGLLNRNEYDVFMYIIRRTLCFQKLSDAISMSQFQNGITGRDGQRLDYGCGIKSSDTISRALKELERQGFIVIQRSTRANGSAAPNLYLVQPENIVAKLKDGEQKNTPTQEDNQRDPQAGDSLESEPAMTANLEGSPIIPPNIPPKFSKAEPEVSGTEGEGYPEDGEELPAKRVDRILDFQNKLNKVGKTEKVKFSRPDPNSSKLAKPQTRGEKLEPSENELLFSLSNKHDQSTLTPLRLADYWQKICQSVVGRLGRSDLASLLPAMQLSRIEKRGEVVECYVRPAEAWQVRLFSIGSVALLELAIRQHLGVKAKIVWDVTKAVDKTG